eukprot:967237-Pelagomonas_calceolata.AAC.1
MPGAAAASALQQQDCRAAPHTPRELNSYSPSTEPCGFANTGPLRSGALTHNQWLQMSHSSAGQLKRRSRHGCEAAKGPAGTSRQD